MLQFLLFMNLPGTIFFIFHTLLLPVEKKLLPPHLRVNIARINLLLFLFPFPLFANYMRNFLSMFRITIFLNTDYNKAITILSDKSIVFPEINIFVLIILAIWSTVLLIKLIKFNFIDAKKFKFFCDSRPLIENSSDMNILKKQIAALQKDLSISGSIQIMIVDGIAAPYVTGILHPKLYVPVDAPVSSSVFTLILRHEFAHLKHHDLLYQRLSIIILILYWYNPIIYFLSKRLSNCDELSADETALIIATEKERKDYGNCILDMLSSQFQSLTIDLIKGCISDQKFLKERIKLMKNVTSKKGKNVKIVLSLVITVFLLSVSLLPVLAYSTPSVIQDPSGILSDEVDSGEWFAFDYVEPVLDNDYAVYKEYFIDSSGKRFPISSISNRIICKHTYVYGTAAKHFPNKSGGCTEKIYKAKRCTSCASVIIIELIESHTYKKCPH